MNLAASAKIPAITLRPVPTCPAKLQWVVQLGLAVYESRHFLSHPSADATGAREELIRELDHVFADLLVFRQTNKG